MTARAQLLRAYGDREGDGMVQLSFTLRIDPGPLALEAGKAFARAHGLRQPIVANAEACGPGYTYFVVYGHSEHTVDTGKLEVPTMQVPVMSHDELESFIEQHIGRKIVVVGACTGTDAHTVGIDAILNLKGFAGEKGLESYKGFDVHNLGSQVENPTLVQRARSLQADAILVSQVVTQRDCHKDNARALMELLDKQGLRSRFVLLFGGPRIDHKLALDLGFDAGFGPGTKPKEVATFIAVTLHQRSHKASP
jgi:beta-lysine 5,6-aminomutase beta subunit